LLPFYRVAEILPRARDSARRLGLVTIDEMVNTLAALAAHRVNGIRIVEVPEIRRLGQPRGRPQQHVTT
jgi:hypothetical protein